jgi:hypothetical protein
MIKFSLTLQKVSTTFADVVIEAKNQDEANEKLRNMLPNPMAIDWGDSQVYVDPPDVITRVTNASAERCSGKTKQ